MKEGIKSVVAPYFISISVEADDKAVLVCFLKFALEAMSFFEVGGVVKGVLVVASLPVVSHLSGSVLFIQGVGLGQHDLIGQDLYPV